MFHGKATKNAYPNNNAPIKCKRPSDLDRLFSGLPVSTRPGLVIRTVSFAGHPTSLEPSKASKL